MQSPTLSRQPNIATPGSDPHTTESIGRLTGSGRKRKTSLRGLESAAYFQPLRQRTKLRKINRPVDAELDSIDGSLDDSVNDSMDGTLCEVPNSLRKFLFSIIDVDFNYMFGRMRPILFLK